MTEDGIEVQREMNRIGAFIAKEIREAMPAVIFFLILFHMIGLTKAVSLGDYSITALRATTATVGALIVAKAILLVEALPLARLFPERRMIQVLWKTLLFGTVALLFRFVEEVIPFVSQHGSVAVAIEAMFREVSWPLFWVAALWLLGGLLLYCLASELVHVAGPEKVRNALFGTRGKAPER